MLNPKPGAEGSISAVSRDVSFEAIDTYQWFCSTPVQKAKAVDTLAVITCRGFCSGLV